MKRASTFDLYVIDAALSYRDYVQRRAEGKLAVDYTSEELAAMMPKRK